MLLTLRVNGSSGNIELIDSGDSLDSIGNFELAENILQMRLDRIHRHVQIRGNLLIGHPRADPTDDLQLSGTENMS